MMNNMSTAIIQMRNERESETGQMVLGSIAASGDVQIEGGTVLCKARDRAVDALNRRGYEVIRHDDGLFSLVRSVRQMSAMQPDGIVLGPFATLNDAGRDTDRQRKADAAARL